VGFGGRVNTTDRYCWGYRSVAPSVEFMSYQRLAYDEQDTARQMHDDCTACAASLPAQRVPDLTAPAPSLRYDDWAEQTRKPTPEVTEAAAHLASRMHLHLD
jgi:hypothetical protein